MLLFLGCPIWGSKRWLGTLFPKGTPSSTFLSIYSQQFSTVEGNTTFYAVPTLEKMAAWAQETPSSFRFCFKFPKIISHDLRLQNAEKETEQWLECIRQLGDRAGPSFLQLPSDFSPEQLPILSSYLDLLSKSPDLRFAIEVRHPGWFEAKMEHNLHQLLTKYRMARVLYDVRGLRSAAPSSPFIREAQKQKPQVPVRFVVTTDFIFVRYISHPEPQKNSIFFQEWAEYLAPFLQEGKRVYFFIHHVDDFYMPTLCQEFYQTLCEKIDLPKWSMTLRQPPIQTNLF